MCDRRSRPPRCSRSSASGSARRRTTRSSAPPASCSPRAPSCRCARSPGRMGMTAPALYRYVASYQELVDLVAFEIDKAATETFAAAADALPEDDYAGRLVASTVEFRMWALANPREFGLAFANPIADAKSVRREMLTLSCSGHLCTDQMRALWEHNHHPIPALDELPPAVREAVLDPLIPAKVEGPGDRGPRPALDLHAGLERALRRGRARGVRPHGPADHRVRRDVRPRGREFAPKLGLADDMDRLEAIIRARFARGSSQRRLGGFDTRSRRASSAARAAQPPSTACTRSSRPISRARRRSWAARRPARSRRPRSRCGLLPTLAISV